MLLRVFCAILIMTGGVLMTITAIRYNSLIKSSENKTSRQSRHVRIAGFISRFMPFIFIVGYIVGRLMFYCGM
ncbi:hypothetical protein K7I13_09370 [Brucepastera parasyntrophica]|uniref:hypothetical protein n=1 Tax=Brucepastera parasyntrophica TaxID=2880008 RepID=UPI00210C9D7F|nr:hypothetical protein [Brucepastera parasyntrophica]ULQ58759.1 hypothetical protein K7I13_09370 [Brucepastera parasyntrophica]